MCTKDDTEIDEPYKCSCEDGFKMVDEECVPKGVCFLFIFKFFSSLYTHVILLGQHILPVANYMYELQVTITHAWGKESKYYVNLNSVDHIFSSIFNWTKK